MVLFIPISLKPTESKIKVKEYFDYPKYYICERSFGNIKGCEIDITDTRISNQKKNSHIK
jgi:hypothetical protein